MKYPKDIVLKNSRRVVIRPFEGEDEALLHRFYSSIPEDERWFIPYDMMDPEMQCRWSRENGRKCIYSIVALCDQEIVAHANLLVGNEGHYVRHVGRIYSNVAPAFRHQRLGTWMILDLIRLAMEKELRDLRVDLVVGVNDTAIEAVKKLDFFKQAVLEDYAMDPNGKRYDMQVLTKRLHKDYGDF